MKLVKYEIRKSVMSIKNLIIYAPIYNPTVEQMTQNLKWHIEILALFDQFIVNSALTNSLRTKS
jgi:hypothetical protein